ncbi:aldehyde dehydrogenase family protein [Dechloromonas sp. HYN0024]|uniref:aldehyde dehydrogenase family protein n=1 Tax=Dechloromonas sp. HYN0024 TaxID=2231055 RepID=UPI000E430524|nr:aldehyde dehydrogenase family protein [Dechloromonas sp. HYN0024]AXS79120.1 aldehyde dehydrogenase family protein [Dechloromonas sp. HYN0024]
MWASEAAEAVSAAQAAQPAWAMMGLLARRVCLSGLADALDRYTGHFAKMLSKECGFDEAHATAEVVDAVAALRGAAVGETGVFALVLDASRPLAGLAEAIAPALMAGATVVVKPSLKAPATVYALCELSGRAEWPAGVLNLMQGDTAAIAGLCASGIDRLVYAGQASLGVQVGAIAEAAGTPFEMKTA